MYINIIPSYVDAFVAVGWGKKETQFHGSEGKGAATKNPIVRLHINE